MPRVHARAQVFTPLELLRQATSIAADMMMQGGKLGCVAEGAHADLIFVDGDPLADIGLLAPMARGSASSFGAGKL